MFVSQKNYDRVNILVRSIAFPLHRTKRIGNWVSLSSFASNADAKTKGRENKNQERFVAVRNSTDGKEINRKNKEKVKKTRRGVEKFVDKGCRDERIGHTKKTSDLFTCTLLDRLLSQLIVFIYIYNNCT